MFMAGVINGISFVLRIRRALQTNSLRVVNEQKWKTNAQYVTFVSEWRKNTIKYYMEPIKFENIEGYYARSTRLGV